MPARKAPSASDKPAAWVAQAEASTASNTASENSSAERTDGNDEKQRPQQPAPGRQHQQQRECGDCRWRATMCAASAPAAAASADTKREQQWKAQVLKQADGHGETAVGAVVLRLLGQLRNDDRRRGHRHGAADRRWRPPARHRRAVTAPAATMAVVTST